MIPEKDLIIERALADNCPVCNKPLKDIKDTVMIGYKGFPIDICKKHLKGGQ